MTLPHVGPRQHARVFELFEQRRGPRIGRAVGQALQLAQQVPAPIELFYPADTATAAALRALA